MDPRPAIKLPKLPGFDVRDPAPADKADFHKAQSLMWKNGYSVVARPPTGPGATQGAGAPAAAPVPSPRSSPSARAGGEATAVPRAPAALPTWLQFEKKVLRFFAHFGEDVPDSAAEAWRVRRVQVLHYLEDGTTQVLEPRDGSGMPQGTLVLRSRIPRVGAGRRDTGADADAADAAVAAIGPEDLGVGRCVTIHGRQLSIVDADPFTREFMAAHGAPQPPALPYPASPFDEYKTQRSKPSGLTRSDAQSPSRFAEALLGRAPSTKRLQQFLEGNNRVLRYWAVWDDVAGQPEGRAAVRRPYKVHYFLEDNSLEVVELQQGNAGREFYHFVKRAPLPKVAGCPPLGQPLEAEQCVGPADLRIGGTLRVYGRDFLLHDADAFTKEYLMVNFGCSAQELVPIDVSQPVSPRPKAPLPPHTGYGDPEDTSHNCVRLVPAPPKRDFKRFMQPNAECEVLRFAARMADGAGRGLTASDRDRRFVLSYHLVDGTLAIYEPAVPNSGVVGGKFLERGKAYKPGSSTERYNERDMWVGAHLALHGRTFELMSADEFTLHHMEANPDAFPMADAAAAAAAVRATMQGATPGGHGGDCASGAAAQLVEEALRCAGAGEMTAAQLQAALQGAGVNVALHQAIAVCRQGQRESAAARPGDTEDAEAAAGTA